MYQPDTSAILASAAPATPICLLHKFVFMYQLDTDTASHISTNSFTDPSVEFKYSFIDLHFCASAFSFN